MKATTVAQVVAAEAGGKTRAERFNSMLDIVSAAVNRSKATGVTIKDVVSVRSQFNAYNTTMPAGTATLTAFAEQAISYVEQNGPVHAGTYYATPEAVSNLPKGLVEIPGVSAAHKVFVDPKNRAIKTAVGTKSVKVSSLPDTVNTVPASRRAGGLLSAMFSPNSVAQTAKPEMPGALAPASMPSPERFGTVNALSSPNAALAVRSMAMAPSAKATNLSGPASAVSRALQDAVAATLNEAQQRTGMPAASIAAKATPREIVDAVLGSIPRDLRENHRMAVQNAVREVTSTPAKLNEALQRTNMPSVSLPSAPVSQADRLTRQLSERFAREKLEAIKDASATVTHKAPTASAMAREANQRTNMPPVSLPSRPSAPTAKAAGTWASKSPELQHTGFRQDQCSQNAKWRTIPRRSLGSECSRSRCCGCQVTCVLRRRGRPPRLFRAVYTRGH